MDIHTLSQVVFIHLDFHLWSGRKKLRTEDLKNLTQEQIPPTTLASLGSKRICSPEDLAPGARCKKQAERVCQLYGFRFLGHFAVPEQRLEALLRGLEVAVADFNAWRSDFLSGALRSGDRPLGAAASRLGSDHPPRGGTSRRRGRPLVGRLSGVPHRAGDRSGR